MAYTFTCPLEGCDHTVMTSVSDEPAEASEELTHTAQRHLEEMHSDIHKTEEEVNRDIREHMVHKQQ